MGATKRCEPTSTIRGDTFQKAAPVIKPIKAIKPIKPIEAIKPIYLKWKWGGVKRVSFEGGCVKHTPLKAHLCSP